MPTALSRRASSPAPDHVANNALGVLWALASVAAASGMTVAVREVAVSVDTRMVVLLRSAMILVGIAAMLPFARGASAVRFTRPGLHLLRGVLLAVSIQLGFYAIAHLPMATVTALFFTAPLFATLLAAPINGEKIGPRRLAASAAGFVGAIIVLRPFDAAFDPAMFASLGSSLLFALALALSRGVAQADGAFSTLISSVVLTILVSIPMAAGDWSMPADAWVWVLVGAVAAFGALRNVADIESYRVGEASVVGVISYLRLVALGGAGWLLYDERPDAMTWVGGSVIVGSTLYIAHRERTLRKAKARAAAQAEAAERQAEAPPAG